MQCNFQQLSIADLKQQQLGASGQRVREVWNQARNNQPAVIFLDECEGILGRRGAAETDVISADIVQAFLAEWDGVAPQARVWVIGATNRRDMLDDAILSRFGWEMEIALSGGIGTGAHLQSGDGVRLLRSRDSGRDGVTHPRDERTRPAASG
jgi:SpoVK/Ycf46/Vps4 family AAA+-type ATPase